jgi:hypothetical protein
MTEIAAVAIALFALGFTIWESRRTNRREELKTTFEQLREVMALVQRSAEFDFEVAAADCIGFYRNDRSDRTPGATALIDLLNALDLLCFAMEKGEIDRDLTRAYLSTVVVPWEGALKKHIREIQECYGDPSVYIHLNRWLPEFSRAHLQPGRR